MSRIFMLKPADGEEGIKKSVIQAVKDAGPNACPTNVEVLDWVEVLKKQHF